MNGSFRWTVGRVHAVLPARVNNAMFDSNHSSLNMYRATDRTTCPVEAAARVVGQKWTLQIVYHLLRSESLRFCQLQEALGGVNPGTLSSRLKLLEGVGMVKRMQISDMPPHVEYRLTDMGYELEDVIGLIASWSTRWLCRPEAQKVASHDS